MVVVRMLAVVIGGVVDAVDLVLALFQDGLNRLKQELFQKQAQNQQVAVLKDQRPGDNLKKVLHLFHVQSLHQIPFA